MILSHWDSFEISLLNIWHWQFCMSQSYPWKQADCFIYGEKRVKERKNKEHKIPHLANISNKSLLAAVLFGLWMPICEMGVKK